MDKKDSDIAVIARCVVVVAAAVVCLLGNALVFRTLLCVKYPKIPLYIVIGSLALADILRVILEVPYHVIIWTHNEDLLTTAWCKASTYLIDVSKYTASSHIAGLSLIRCILRNDRRHSRNFVRHSYIACAVLWTVILFTNIPNIITSIKGEGTTSCVEENTEIGVSDEVKQWLAEIFSFFLPLIFIGIIYIITYYFSKKYFEDSYSRKERRLSRMVTFLIVSWAIFKLPLVVVGLLQFYEARRIEKLVPTLTIEELLENKYISNFLMLDEVTKILECLSFLDLAIRPIIYAKLSYYFSNSFDQIINCTTCRDTPPSRRLASSCPDFPENNDRTPLDSISMDGTQDDGEDALSEETGITELIEEKLDVSVEPVEKVVFEI